MFDILVYSLGNSIEPSGNLPFMPSGIHRPSITLSHCLVSELSIFSFSWTYTSAILSISDVDDFSNFSNSARCRSRDSWLFRLEINEFINAFVCSFHKLHHQIHLSKIAFTPQVIPEANRYAHQIVQRPNRTDEQSAPRPNVRFAAWELFKNQPVMKFMAQ
jgi:hypothetical protein